MLPAMSLSLALDLNRRRRIMNFVKFVIVFLSSSLLLVSCDDTDPVNQDSTVLSSLDGNSYVFEMKLASTTELLENQRNNCTPY